MKRTTALFTVFGLGLLAMNCSTLTAVRALHKGESAVGLSCGGPVTDVSGMSIPLPMTVASYRYGIDDRFGVYADGNLLMAALGIVGLSGGFSYQFLDQRGWVPALSSAGGFKAFIEPGGDQRLFPELSLAASYLAADRFLTYIGVQSMYQLNYSPAVVFAPLVGEQVSLNRNLSLVLEAKWYAPTEITSPRVVEYKLPIGNHGALGFVLGANFGLGGKHE
jgi:hypothetical protein